MFAGCSCLRPPSIHACIRRKDLDGVRHRLEEGTDVNERGSSRKHHPTPLIAAAKDGLTAIVEALLKYNADTELQDDKGLTALYRAVTGGHVETALVLLRHGAAADTVLGTGKSALHEAADCQNLELVEAMLESGADPSVRDRAGHTCVDYHSGKLARANSPRILRALQEFSSMADALAAKNAGAAAAIIRRSIRRDQLDKALADYVAAATVLPEAVLPHRLAVLHWALRMGLRDEFQRALTCGIAVDAADEQSSPQVQRLLGELRFPEDKDATALHVAARFGHVHLVEFLITNGRMSPSVRDRENRLPIEVIDDAADAHGKTRFLLTQVAKKLRFDECANRLLRETIPATAVEFEELAQTLTSVHEFRILYALGVHRLGDRATTSRILRAAFQRVIEDRLVLGDRDAVFFRLVLRECHAQGFVSEAEVEHWSLQLVKVNMAGAEWVTELRRSIRRLDMRAGVTERNTELVARRFELLRQALAQKGDGEGKDKGEGDNDGEGDGDERRDVVGKLVSMLMSAVLTVGGSFLEDKLELPTSLAEPFEFLKAAQEAVGEDVQEIVQEKLTDLVVEHLPGDENDKEETHGSMKSILDEAQISPAEFASVLRQAAEVASGGANLSGVTERPVAVRPAPLRAYDSIAQLGIELDEIKLSTAHHALDGERSIVAIHTKRAREDPANPDEAFVNAPYHFAVKKSRGDLSAFRQMVAYIEPQDGDINATVPVRAIVNGEEQPYEDVGAAIYASYLGYVEIVQYFLDRGDYVSVEKKYRTIQRAQERHEARDVLSPPPAVG